MKEKIKVLNDEVEKPTINITTIKNIVAEIYRKVGIWGCIAIAFGVLGILMFVMPHWFNLPWPWFVIVGSALCIMSFILIVLFGTIYTITHYKLKKAQILADKQK